MPNLVVLPSDITIDTAVYYTINGEPWRVGHILLRPRDGRICIQTHRGMMAVGDDTGLRILGRIPAPPFTSEPTPKPIGAAPVPVNT